MNKKQWIFIAIVYAIYLALTLWFLEATGGFDVPDWWKG